jgi:carboxylate-amine ligase
MDVSTDTRAGVVYVPETYDEAVEPTGEPRPAYADLLPAMLKSDLVGVRERMRDHLREAEIDFRSEKGSDEFRLDPIPRIITATEWEELEGGLKQRARALNAFVEDTYGERRAIREGAVPAEVVETAEFYEPDMAGIEVRGWRAAIIGFDVVRDHNGRFLILEENLSTPSGLAYALAARAAMDAFAGVTPPRERRDTAVAIELIGEAIRAAAPDGVDEPAAAVLSDGPSNSAWFEHRELAFRLGLPVVLSDDVVIRDGYVHEQRTGERPRRLDVLYRRTDEARLRDEEDNATWNAEVLLEPLREGRVAVVPPFGVSVGDDKLSHVHVEAMIRFYLGEEPLLPSVPSYDLSDDDVREMVLDRLDEMVVKPRAESGGKGVIVEPDGREAREVAAEVQERPTDFIAQETVRLSTHPTLCGSAIEPRHIDLRAFAIAGEIAPGGITRVALERGSLIVNSSRDGGAKDTWVLR